MNLSFSKHGWVVLWLVVASHSALAALAELNQCEDLPSEIVFSAVPDTKPGQAFARRREERFGGRIRQLGPNPEEFAGHGLAHVRNCTRRPPGAQQQVMRFWLRSDGYFTEGVVNHLAIGLRARSVGYSVATHTGHEGRQGRGLVLGSINQGWPAERLCPGAFPLVQPETWGLVPGVTTLWGRSSGGTGYCGPTLRDGRWYHFEISSGQGRLDYQVEDQAGRVIYKNRLLDSYTPEPDRSEIEQNTGYFFAVMCADKDWTCRNAGAWKIRVKDFSVRWQ